MEKDKAVGVDGADRVGLLAALMREIDSDEGYLSDGWLERLRFLDFTPSTAAEFLVGCLPLIKPHVSCMSLEIQDAIDGIRGPVKHIMFSTGGWSGAEDLIDAMMKHFWITHFHTQWNRGGHFQFEVPVRHLKVPTLNPQESASPASHTTREASKRPEGATTESARVGEGEQEMNLDVRYSSNGNTVYINAVALANLPVPKKYREAVVLAIREAFERGAAHRSQELRQLLGAQKEEE